jgi:hypothetical protein
VCCYAGPLNGIKKDPATGKNVVWPFWRRSLWWVFFSSWILFTFDMFFGISGFAIFYGLITKSDCALMKSNVGPRGNEMNVDGQVLPIALLNLLMPSFMHCVLGFYDKRYATMCGTIFLTGVIWLSIQTDTDDWGSVRKPWKALVALVLFFVVHMCTSAITSYSVMGQPPVSGQMMLLVLWWLLVLLWLWWW